MTIVLAILVKVCFGLMLNVRQERLLAVPNRCCDTTLPVQRGNGHQRIWTNFLLVVKTNELNRNEISQDVITQISPRQEQPLASDPVPVWDSVCTHFSHIYIRYNLFVEGALVGHMWEMEISLAVGTEIGRASCRERV